MHSSNLYLAFQPTFIPVITVVYYTVRYSMGLIIKAEAEPEARSSGAHEESQDIFVG